MQNESGKRAIIRPLPQGRHTELNARLICPPDKSVTHRSVMFAAMAVGKSEVIKIWSRRSTILPQFVGLTFGVYNGKKHIPVAVTEEMIGQKFGEYSPTRTYYGHAADKKAKRK